MEYAAELSAEVSETTSGEFRECRTRFAIKIEGKNRGGEGKNPVTTDRPESWRLKRVIKGRKKAAHTLRFCQKSARNLPSLDWRNAIKEGHESES